MCLGFQTWACRYSWSKDQRRETLGLEEVLCTKTNEKGDEYRRCSTVKVGPRNEEKAES